MSLASDFPSAEPPRPRRAPDKPPARPALAALPCYDAPGLRQANDALWAFIAGRLEDAGVPDTPRELTRGGDPETLWRNPRLLLAQACAYRLATRLEGKVRLVATPRYRSKGCDGPFHRSAVVVRSRDRAQGLADLHGRRCAVSDLVSNTAMNLLRAELAAPARGGTFFSAVTVTGSDAASAAAVADGKADLAAIDAVVLDQLQRFRPDLSRSLRVLHWTVRTPAPPMITAQGTSAAVHARLLLALEDAAHDPALREARGLLRLDGFNVLPASHYRAVLYLEQIAVDQGYPVLA